MSLRRGLTSRQRLVLVAAFATAATLWLVIVYCHSAPIIWADSCGYLSAARTIHNEGVFGYRLVQLNPDTLADPPDTVRGGWWPPLYPFVISLIAGDSINTAEGAERAFFGLNLAGQLASLALLGWLIVSATGSLPAGFVAVGVYVLSAPSIWEAPRVVSEHLFMPLLLGAMLAQLRSIHCGRVWPALLAGVLWGLAGLTRHNALVLLACACLAALIIQWKGGFRPVLVSAFIPGIMGAPIWGAWAVRNLMVTGEVIGGYYAPGTGDLFLETVRTLRGFLEGFATLPWHASLWPAYRTGLSLFTALLVIVAWLVSIRWIARQRNIPKPQRWLVAVGALMTAVSLAMLISTNARFHINNPLGRFMLPPLTGTLCVLLPAAVRERVSRAVLVVLSICVALGGLELGISRLMEPGGRALTRACRPDVMAPLVESILQGRPVLLSEGPNIAPASVILTVSLYIPRVKTLYWIDSPSYSGVTVDSGHVEQLAARTGMRHVLQGPPIPIVFERYWPESRRVPLFPVSWQLAFRERVRARFTAADELQRDSTRPLELRKRVTAAGGVWRLLELELTESPG
ncbi:MAG: hypothetical protein HPY44_10580 [Armatimonadetes bacterium]|nr:hypothetical protein [Armatimonadota bacterium]